MKKSELALTLAFAIFGTVLLYYFVGYRALVMPVVFVYGAFAAAVHSAGESDTAFLVGLPAICGLLVLAFDVDFLGVIGSLTFGFMTIALVILCGQLAYERLKK